MKQRVNQLLSVVLMMPRPAMTQNHSLCSRPVGLWFALLHFVMFRLNAASECRQFPETFRRADAASWERREHRAPSWAGAWVGVHPRLFPVCHSLSSLPYIISILPPPPKKNLNVWPELKCADALDGFLLADISRLWLAVTSPPAVRSPSASKCCGRTTLLSVRFRLPWHRLRTWSLYRRGRR